MLNNLLCDFFSSLYFWCMSMSSKAHSLSADEKPSIEALELYHRIMQDQNVLHLLPCGAIVSLTASWNTEQSFLHHWRELLVLQWSSLSKIYKWWNIAHLTLCLKPVPNTHHYIGFPDYRGMVCIPVSQLSYNFWMSLLLTANKRQNAKLEVEPFFTTRDVCMGGWMCVFIYIYVFNLLLIYIHLLQWHFSVLFLSKGLGGEIFFLMKGYSELSVFISCTIQCWKYIVFPSHARKMTIKLP